MIKTYDIHLPVWIEQASFGFKGTVRPTEDDMFWSMLTNSCPLIFESYAIILHPFGINWKTKELNESGLLAKRDDEGMELISWRDFFKYNDVPFTLETAYKVHCELIKKYKSLESKWPTYLGSPDEGIYDSEKLQLIINEIASIYGDQFVNYYYIFYACQKMG